MLHSLYWVMIGNPETASHENKNFISLGVGALYLRNNGSLFASLSVTQVSLGVSLILPCSNFRGVGPKEHSFHEWFYSLQKRGLLVRLTIKQIGLELASRETSKVTASGG
jgi:hypothetical protein